MITDAVSLHDCKQNQRCQKGNDKQREPLLPETRRSRLLQCDWLISYIGIELPNRRLAVLYDFLVPAIEPAHPCHKNYQQN